MEINPDMLEMMWTGVFIAIGFLVPTALWCLVAGIINKSVSG